MIRSRHEGHADGQDRTRFCRRRARHRLARAAAGIRPGAEIVVCSRKAEAERYRIPEELRESFKGARPSWAERAQSIEYAGRGGTQSCSPVGPGGASGCYNKIVRQARGENKQDGADTAGKF